MRLSLDKTWEECLLMWKWLSKKVIDDPYLNIDDLKKTYTDVKEYNILQDCFFCEYADRHLKETHELYPFPHCTNCPGKKVYKDFNCLYYPKYSTNPVEFYKMLVKLNRIRQAKRNSKRK